MDTEFRYRHFLTPEQTSKDAVSQEPEFAPGSPGNPESTPRTEFRHDIFAFSAI